MSDDKSTPSKDADNTLVSFVTCPKCSHVQKMNMPTESCQVFYECNGCNERISAEKSCCVFCDYGDRKCPVAAEHDTAKTSEAES